MWYRQVYISSPRSHRLLQKLARGITQSMQEVTQLGLKQIQTKADLVALNAMCERKEQKLMKAKVEHQRRELATVVVDNH